MREYAARRGWAVVGEYVDYARAADFSRRKRWRELLADTQHRRIDLVAVWPAALPLSRAALGSD
jgi:DNA invertase Pin-like site-specific DNA recombinase